MSKEGITAQHLEDFIKALASNLDDYEFYNDVLFNGEEIMDMVFKDYIADIEGSMCCADKSRFIVRRIKNALKERKNISLQETYAEYRDNGGNLGGINENNADLNEICYWCPKTIKDTDSAINLYFELLNVPRYVRSQLNEKDQQLAELKAKLKESNRINEKNRLEIEKLKQNDKLLAEKMADNSKLTLENEQLKAENEELKNANIVIFEDNKKLEEENFQLQQQLKEKDEEIKKLEIHNQILIEKSKFDVLDYEDIEKLINQKDEEIKFANKEIERLKKSNNAIHNLHNNLYFEYQKKVDELKTNTYQVCDKIREYLIAYFGGKEEYKSALDINLYLELPIRELIQLLNQIEKGAE